MQIIHVNLTQENAKPLEEGRVLEMTYSVKFVPTNTSFARRFDVYLDYPFFEHQVNFLNISSFQGIMSFCIYLLIIWDIWYNIIFPLMSAHERVVILQIHWFSVFNSFMMVIFLTGLVSMILMRTLRNDYAKYAREDDDLESLVVSS